MDNDFQEKLSLGSRLRHGWNAFKNKDPSAISFEPELMGQYPQLTGYHSGSYVSTLNQPRRFRLAGVDQTFVTSIYERLATDVSSVEFMHCKVDDNKRYLEPVKSGLNYCLTTEANIDQTGRELLIDIVLTMLDGDGVAAVVPIDTTISPMKTGSYDIQTLRVGTVIDWQPRDVKIQVYNDRTGLQQQLWLPKQTVALIINPFREIMNAPNSTLRRLTRKLALLDDIDEQSGSGKLDLLIQLPYVLKNQAKMDEAAKRHAELESQLENSKLGIGYIDATEKVIQLNRPIENNLLAQIEYLTKMLYTQLGLTDEIMNGTASESAMINYYHRTRDPILNAIKDELTRKFLTKTARSQGQAILYFSDPFALTTSENLAEIADKFTRNEIVSSNEMRSVIGFKPIDDVRADELRNKNLNPSAEQLMNPITTQDTNSEGDVFDEEIGL